MADMKDDAYRVHKLTEALTDRAADTVPSDPGGMPQPEHSTQISDPTFPVA